MVKAGLHTRLREVHTRAQGEPADDHAVGALSRQFKYSRASRCQIDWDCPEGQKIQLGLPHREDLTLEVDALMRRESANNFDRFAQRDCRLGAIDPVLADPSASPQPEDCAAA